MQIRNVPTKDPIKTWDIHWIGQTFREFSDLFLTRGSLRVPNERSNVTPPYQDTETVLG